MTVYLGYDELKALLIAGWNVAIIALPSFEDWLLSDEGDMNSIPIKVDPAAAKPITTGVATKDNIITEFWMQLIAENKTNADLYLGEVRRIINTTITNGWRRITGWKRIKSTDFFVWEVEGREFLRDFA